MQITQFKWYILEEVVAYLLKSSWYKIISNPGAWDSKLKLKHNWLNLEWRWWLHQIDTLWEFKRNLFFTNPIRLIIEAKFKWAKQWIDVVRNTIWILKDINENYSLTTSLLENRYQYVSAIFSASWFTQDAFDMALAHNITLIDLNEVIYGNILNDIDSLVNNLTWNNTNIDKESAKSIRMRIRQILWQDIYIEGSYEIPDSQIQTIENFTNQIRDRQIILGMTKWWYSIALYGNELDRFIEYCIDHNTHKIAITWTGEANWWIIRTISHNNDYSVNFFLPSYVSEKILWRREAIHTKQSHLSTITFYYTDQSNKDYVFNLTFDMQETINKLRR